MGMAVGVLVGLLQVALPVAVIVYLVRRRRGHAGMELGLVVRRLLEYGFLYVLLWITCVGAAGLLSELFEVFEGAAGDDMGSGGGAPAPAGDDMGGGAPVGDETGEIALWWTFSVVGGAALAGHSLLLRRRFTSGPDQVASTFWQMYLTVVDLTALGAGIISLILTLSWPIAGHSFNAGASAALLVTVAVWAVHWRLAGRLHGTTSGRNQAHMLTGSVIGMAGLGVSFALALSQLLGWFYDGVTPTAKPDIDGWVPLDATFDEVADALPSLFAFGLVWWWYWWRNARHTAYSGIRHAYVLVVGVLGGLAAAVTAISATLFLSLSWWLVDQHGMSATEHFDPAPQMIAALVAGIALWVYHRAQLPPVQDRTEVERSYDYLSAWVGLVAFTVGLYVLLEGVLLTYLLRDSDSRSVDADAVVLLLVLLSVGGTVWWRAWSRTRSHADDQPELSSSARRTYLFVVFGATALAVLISFLFLVFNLVYGLLEQDLSPERIADMGVPLAVIGSTLGAAIYHGRFVRQAPATLVEGHASELRPGGIKTHGLSHVSLSVEDPEVSLAFYQALFRVREYFRDEDSIQVLGPGEYDVIAFERRRGHGVSGGIHHFGFRLTSPEGFESVIEQAKLAGATILLHGERSPGEPYLFIADPDGYEIEIWYERPPTEEWQGTGHRPELDQR